MFSRCTLAFNYFRETKKIGDVVTIDDEPVLLIGIEDIEFDGLMSNVAITYTTQRLDVSYTDQSGRSLVKSDDEVMGYGRVYAKGASKARVGNDPLRAFRPGKTLEIEGVVYKILEYRDVLVKEGFYEVWALMKVLHPVMDRTVVQKAKRERLKTLGITLVK